MNAMGLSILFAQDNGAGAAVAAAMGLVVLLVELVLIVAVIAGMWKMFEKAGKPGWAAIIPIYNIIVLLEVVGKPIWWVVLFLIPCVNIVASIIIALDVARVFGKSAGYGVGLILLPFVFYPMLGFSNAKYLGPIA